MTRRAFNPTAEQRGNVEAMIGYGIPEADICLLIKNPETGKPIDLKTLRSHFAREIATGVTKLKSLAGNRIVAAMLGRDGRHGEYRRSRNLRRYRKVLTL